MSIFKQLALLLISLSLFACSTTTVSSMESQHIALTQMQKKWRLVRINGQSINPEINSTLNVDPQAQATGKLACNNFFGTLILKDNSLKIDPMGSTRMMCPKPMSDVEIIVSSVLNDWSEIQLTSSELTLSGKTDTLTYRAN